MIKALSPPFPVFFSGWTGLLGKPGIFGKPGVHRETELLGAGGPERVPEEELPICQQCWVQQKNWWELQQFRLQQLQQVRLNCFVTCLFYALFDK